jgi:glycosyltransferase involved in cell wall biosynthesis
MVSRKPVVLVVLEPALTEVGYVSKYIPLIKKHIDFDLFEVHIIGSFLGLKPLKEEFSHVHSVRFSPIAMRGLGLYVGYVSYLFFVFFNVIRVAPKIGAQVLVSLGGHVYSGLVVSMASKLLNRKSIIRISEPTRYIVWSRYALGPIISSFIKVFERLAFALSNVVISNRDMRWYSSKIGKKQVVLSQGVDLSLFNSNVDPIFRSKALPRLITVSRLDKQKNIESVIEAVGLLKSKYPDILYYIVGSGPDADDLRDKVAKLSLNKHVCFYGQATPKMIPKLLRSFNIFVLASFVEGLPSAVLEAMACGLPVILASTNYSCQESFKNEENALVVSGHSEAIAEAIDRLVSDNQLRSALIINGQEYVRTHHDSSKTCKYFTEAVKRLTNPSMISVSEQR